MDAEEAQGFSKSWFTLTPWSSPPVTGKQSGVCPDPFQIHNQKSNTTKLKQKAAEVIAAQGLHLHGCELLLSFPQRASVRH